jgi:histidyl-tRNA synthetase
MLRGTQILMGQKAEKYRDCLQELRLTCLDNGYFEIVVPSIWEAKPFDDKIQGDTKEQIWKFKDRGDRDCCLIPEVTAIVQEMYNNNWSKEIKKPIRLFYQSKVFRYDRPQQGRYREFTQFGVEILGTITEELENECKDLLKACVETQIKNYIFNPSVQRGLGYYTSNGFEIEYLDLGAQKQVAGGGKYKEGIGWAIGVERLLLASNGDRSSDG